LPRRITVIRPSFRAFSGNSDRARRDRKRFREATRPKKGRCYTIHLDGDTITIMPIGRSRVVPEVKPRIVETEKITINLGLIDLGEIDLLVQEGFYSNRTDLIRTAIRNQLAVHADVLRQTVARRTLVLGLQQFSKDDLQALRKSRMKLRIQVLGLVRIADDVSPALARDTIESISVLGAFHASAGVKAALAGRIH
jgi:Arc/MetJ-type ribon-helix-helix transcriptional regulator